MLPLFLGKLEKFESLETRFLDHDGNGFFVRPKEKDPMVFNDIEGILVGLYRSAAHFLHAQGSHGPVVVLGHLQNQNTRGKKLFNPIGEVVACPRRKVRGDKVGRGKIGLQQVNEHPSVFLHPGR